MDRRNYSGKEDTEGVHGAEPTEKVIKEIYEVSKRLKVFDTSLHGLVLCKEPKKHIALLPPLQLLTSAQVPSKLGAPVKDKSSEVII